MSPISQAVGLPAAARRRPQRISVGQGSSGPRNGTVPFASVTLNAELASMYCTARFRSLTPLESGSGARASVLRTPRPRPWRSRKALPESPGTPGLSV